MRLVANYLLMSGRGSFLGPDTYRRTHWYELTLECGHIVERNVKYKPRSDGRAVRSGGWQPRHSEDALPPPKRARCDHCRA